MCALLIEMGYASSSECMWCMLRNFCYIDNMGHAYVNESVVYILIDMAIITGLSLFPLLLHCCHRMRFSCH